MREPGAGTATAPLAADAASRLREAAAARKCWPCGCLHTSLAAIEQAEGLPRSVEAAVRETRERLEPVRYDCLGCEVCYPALAVNSLGQEGFALADISACPTEAAAQRPGWPPLPGAYSVLRYRAPVAVCTLTDRDLADSLAHEAGPEIAIVGTLQTENLGIERLIRNVVGNPNIRFLVVCGDDSRQAIGHLPGQSLLALAAGGVDDRGRIVGARGKRPVLRNLAADVVARFRRTVEVLDLVGESRSGEVFSAVRRSAERNPGPAEPFEATSAPTPITGRLPATLVLDPAGYFIVHVDRSRRLLAVEHYRNDGLFDGLVEGRTATEVWTPAIERGLVSRLDHAAYLGRELARAEHALVTGEPYVQDAAPEGRMSVEAGASCACGSGSAEDCS